MERILLILKNNRNIEEIFNYLVDMKKISIFPKEEEILIFPFFCFDIINIDHIYERGEVLTRIELSYLSRDDARLKNANNISESYIDESFINSEFKKEIHESNIIELKIL